MMTRNALWSGLACALGGLLWMIGVPGLDEQLPPYSHDGGHLIVAAAGLFTLLGLLGYIASLGGGRGKVGASVAACGAALVFVGNLLEGTFRLDIGWGLFMLGVLGLIIGSMVLGLSSARAASLPGPVIWLLIAAPILLLTTAFGSLVLAASGLVAEPPPDSPLRLVPLIVSAILGLAWVSLGVTLWLNDSRSNIDFARRTGSHP